jgi:hypothetical protein
MNYLYAFVKKVIYPVFLLILYSSILWKKQRERRERERNLIACRWTCTGHRNWYPLIICKLLMPIVDFHVSGSPSVPEELFQITFIVTSSYKILIVKSRWHYFQDCNQMHHEIKENRDSKINCATTKCIVTSKHGVWLYRTKGRCYFHTSLIF